MSGARPTLVKKYSNRRLYDTELSRYVTVEELADKVRGGGDVVVIDAKSGEDLTQATLLQIILETPASKLLPVGVLARLIRMQDDALAEFFGRHVATALDLYLAARQGASSMAPVFPFAQLPLSATAAMARLLGQVPGWGESPQVAPYAASHYQGYASPVPPPPPPPPPGPTHEVSSMRGEIDALRRELQGMRELTRPSSRPAPAPSTKAAAKSPGRASKPRARPRRDP